MQVPAAATANPKDCVCICRRYCNGEPRTLSETTFYRHLAAADEDERIRIKIVKVLSLEAAHKIISNPVAANPPNPAPTASSSNAPSVLRMATLQGLAKRAREAPDAQRRLGKRKCARNKENFTPEPDQLQHSNAVPVQRPILLPTSTVAVTRATKDLGFAVAHGNKNIETTPQGTENATVRATEHLEVACRDNETKTGPTAVANNDETVVIPYANPLNSLADIAAKLDIQIPEPAPKPDPPAPIASTADNSSAGASSCVPPVQRTTAKKIAKMRPGPVRNGRNLCAHRWLKQFKDTTNGTTAEFKIYHEALTKEQREAYDKEAADLVTRNAWNKDALNGPML